ncbi:hypothetical protein Tco_0009230, partial [Tanacetum coccineum]
SLDQKVEETLQESELVAIEDVTFEQIMDEFDSETRDAQENDESPYDNESEIKIIKSYQDDTISDADEGDASESLSGLRFMPDDDLASMTGFEIQDFAYHVSEEGTDTLLASADKPAQSDPLGHLHEELCLLNNKVNQLESSITKHVSDSIKSTVTLIVTNTLKEQLPGLLLDALKDTLPQLIKDSIKSSVSESIAEELPQVEAQVQKNLQDQLPNILLKPMYKEFNAFNKLESRRFDNLQGHNPGFGHLHEGFPYSTIQGNQLEELPHVEAQRFVLLQKELANSLHNKMRKSIDEGLRIMFIGNGFTPIAAEVFKKANAEGEKWRKTTLNHLLKKKMLNILIKLRGSKTKGLTSVAIVQRDANHQLMLYQMQGQGSLVIEYKSSGLHTLRRKEFQKKTLQERIETDDE